ncbi:3288_t:CDS:10 [Diversispora eburnea]|uniref:Condensin complex subunit 2 n=1 Tax=Diversispora eburnea TaxID=1213867 RepID=A0A9N9F7U2_9GLOM|nr:3288_t:CDS:10 [Diversispora eburnea]
MDMSETPPRRRHSAGTSLKAPQRKLNAVPLNDDEWEKRQRRKSLMESSRRKSLLLSSPNTPGGSQSFIITTTPQRPLTIDVVTPIPKIPPEQMYNNFEEWMKMATDNKINAHNSWKLALIDYFHEMRFLKEGDSINFQKASCTLDGCVKIYTSRVDSVATETGKLLSGLADSTKKDNDQFSENEDDEGEEGVDSERRVRKKTRSETTLVKDYSQITIKKFDLEFSVDPLFKKTCADFDEGGAQGLLLNHLSIDTDSKIIFDASDAILDLDDIDNDNDLNAMEEDISEQDMDLSKLRSKFYDQLSHIFTKKICPSLRSFEFSGENNGDLGYLIHKSTEDDEDEENNQPGSSDDFLFNGIDDNPDYPDFFANDEFLEEDDEADENGIREIFNAENVIESRNNQPIENENEFVTAMANHQNDMFSYFDSAFLRNWAGPEHWKLKRVVKEDVDESTIFISGGSTLILPKLAEYVPHGYRLPDDIHFSSKQLLQLFLKPEYKLRSKRRYEEKIDNGDDPEVDENFWAEENINDNAFPDTKFGDNLVTQTRRVKPDQIKFARTAKRVDVKKLKDNIWKTLVFNNEENFTRRSLSDNNLTSDQDDENQTTAPNEQITEQKFTTVIKDLKRIYPEKKIKDISVPFCFICLLHLANEKNLSISVVNEQLTELEIKKVEENR